LNIYKKVLDLVLRKRDNSIRSSANTLMHEGYDNGDEIN